VFVAPKNSSLAQPSNCVRLEKGNREEIPIDQLEELRSKLVLGVVVEEVEIELLVDYFQSLLLYLFSYSCFILFSFMAKNALILLILIQSISTTAIQLHVAGHFEYQEFNLRVDPQTHDVHLILSTMELERKKLSNTGDKLQIEGRLAKVPNYNKSKERLEMILNKSLEYPSQTFFSCFSPLPHFSLLFSSTKYARKKRLLNKVFPKPRY
jgi:hypothetical protein